MKKVLNDNWSMDDIRTMLKKLHKRNNLNLIFVAGAVLIMLVALVSFLAYRCRCSDNIDYYFDDDDFEDLDGDFVTDDDFE